MKKLLLILVLLFAPLAHAQSSVSVNLGSTYANGSLIAELLPAAGGNVATTHIFLDANGATTIQTLVPGKTYGFWASAVDGTALLYGRVTVTGAAQDITAVLFAVGGSNGTCNVGLSGPGGIFTVSGTPAACNAVLTLMTTGNSGGIPCFTNATTLNSSATLNSKTLVAGGGTGACPGNSSVTDDNLNPTRMPNGVNMGSSYLVIESQNTSPGTLLNSLACNSGANVSVCPANPAPGTIVGISEQGSGSSSGIVALCILGPCPVIFDNQSVIGDVAIPGSVSGALHDTGGTAQVAGLNFRVSGANTGAGTVGSARPPGDVAGSNSLVSCLTTTGDIWSSSSSGVCQRLAAPVTPNGVAQFLVSTPSGGVGTNPVYVPAGIVPRFVTALSDTILATDRAGFVQYTNASPQAVTLPQPGSTGFANNFMTCVESRGAGVVTFTSTSSTINGQPTYPLTQNNSACFITDNTNWYTKDVTTSGSILPTNNQFTGTNNFGANVSFKGPNPYYDLTQYGLYTGSTFTNITCTTTATSNSASCGGGISDFAIGNGISIPGAGVAAAFPAWGVTNISFYTRGSNIATYKYTTGSVPAAGQTVVITGLSDSTFNGTFTVTGNDGDFNDFSVANTGSNVVLTAGAGVSTITSPNVVVQSVGILNGSTTYAYKVVLRGYHGELSVASPAGTFTTGATALGVNTISVSSVSRVAGLTTVTTSAAHNFQSGVPVNILGVADPAFNGAFTIASTPTATTFTFYQNGFPDTTNTTGTASVVAKNLVQWNMQQYVVLQSIIYRSKNGGAYSIAGITEGMDNSFIDWGLGAPTAPLNVPSTPPVATTNGILATTITGISGTTLTLATAATASTTSSIVQHDATPNVLAGCAVMPSAGGGTMMIPVTNPLAVTGIYFSSPLDFYHNCNVSEFTLEVGAPIHVQEPIIWKKSGMTMKGIPGDAVNSALFPSFTTTRIIGDSYPFIYFVPGTFGPSTLENFQMIAPHPYQSCVTQDQDAGGGGVASITYNNDYFGGVAGAMPMLMRSGGFDFYFNGGSFQVDSGSWGVPEALTITVNHGLGIGGGQYGNGLSGIMEFHNTHFGGQGIVYEAYGFNPLGNVVGNVTMYGPLIENSYGPFLRYDVLGNPVILTTIYGLTYSDPLAGQATPLIDVTNVSNLSTYKVFNPSCSAGFQPLFEGNIVGGVEISNGFSGCGTIGLPAYISHNLRSDTLPTDIYNNASVEILGGGELTYAMAVPAPPTFAVSSGGSVPLGAHIYQITAVDINGGETTASTGVTATATTGNQTITITPPVLPGGAVGWRAYRDFQSAVFPGCSLHPPSFISPTATFVDTFGFICGLQEPVTNTAGSSSIGANGVSGQKATFNIFSLLTSVFSVLPACAAGTEGQTAAVTDSTTAVWGATITGSGTNHVLAYCDGTNWTVAAK